jgi:hypothetical protein
MPMGPTDAVSRTRTFDHCHQTLEFRSLDERPNKVAGFDPLIPVPTQFSVSNIQRIPTHAV